MAAAMIRRGVEWIDQVGRDVHLGISRVNHQFVLGIDTPGGRIPAYLTACDLERLGLEAIRITGRYAVFDFSETPPARTADPFLPPVGEQPK